MEGNIILPPDFSKDIGRLITVIGPRGGSNWQNSVIEEIFEQDDSLTLALSRLPSPAQRYYPSDTILQEWQRHYLELASHYGSPMFWMAKDNILYNQYPYAAQAKMLLQEWFKRHQIDGYMFSLGIEPGFVEGEAIAHRCRLLCPDIPISDNLRDTSINAIELAYLKPEK